MAHLPQTPRSLPFYLRPSVHPQRSAQDPYQSILAAVPHESGAGHWGQLEGRFGLFTAAQHLTRLASVESGVGCECLLDAHAINHLDFEATRLAAEVELLHLLRSEA